MVHKLSTLSTRTGPPGIKADQVAAKVSPMLYGLMTEEINYSYDGGLYAELVRNRTFKWNTNTPCIGNWCRTAVARVQCRSTRTNRSTVR